MASTIVLAAGGAIYDPSDLTSLYQSRTGGSTGASGSPVGIMLDKSRMGGRTAAAFIAGQAEKVTNGTFAGNVTGWTTTGSATLAYHSGEAAAEINVTGVGGGLTDAQTLTTVSGRWYLIEVEMKLGTLSGTALTVNANGTNIQTFTVTSNYTTFTTLVAATDTDMEVAVIRGGAFTGTFYVKSISLKEIPGFHALAPSDAARPLLTVAGGLAYLAPDGVDDWMNVTPTLNLGEAWWHVGGWRSDTSGRRSFATSTDNKGSLNHFNASNYGWRNSADTNVALMAGAPASIAVVTIEQTSTSAISGRYNGGADASITPWDDSAATQGLALFSGLNNAWATGLAGRFYGGAFAPGALSTGNRSILEAYVATLAGVTL